MTRQVLCMLAAAALVGGCAETGSTATEPNELVMPLMTGGAAVRGEQANFRAHASGREEVPANDSRAQGQAIFRLSADGQELYYKLIVANIQNVTQAHIHIAPAGQNGAVVLWLYPSSPPAQLIPGRTQGILGEGTATAEDLVGPLAGASLGDLLELMRTGGAYVNVHTSQFPPGEVRGQIH